MRILPVIGPGMPDAELRAKYRISIYGRETGGKRMKRFTAIVLAIVIIVTLTACTKTEKEDPPYRSRFVIVERTGEWKIAYDRETLVMYSVSRGYAYGNFSPLYNADGSLLLYEGG